MRLPLILIAALASGPGTSERWAMRAEAVARAVGDSDPALLEAACAAVRQPIAGTLPAWTMALGPYCHTAYQMTVRSELPVPLWRRLCRDGRRAVALLRRARPADGARAADAARRLVTLWQVQYAASCPAVIPPSG